MNFEEAYAIYEKESYEKEILNPTLKEIIELLEWMLEKNP